jgi:hypothetical protein
MARLRKIWQLWLTLYFPAVLTVVVVLALSGIAFKVRGGAIDKIFVGLLLIAVGAVIAIRYLDDVMRRVTKIGPGGLELSSLSAADPAVTRLLEDPIIEWRNVRNPFGDRPLTARERWIYEGLTARFLQLEFAHVEMLDLKNAALERYRSIAFRLGYLALLNDDVAKAIDVLKDFETLPDARGDELFVLATAIAERADDPDEPSEPSPAYRHAVKLLERAKQRDPTDAMIAYQLGWLHDELGQYAHAIEENRRARELDAALFPQTTWNMAVSTLKAGDPPGAIEHLRSIPPGSWWDEIAEDPELARLRTFPEWPTLLEAKRGAGA